MAGQFNRAIQFCSHVPVLLSPVTVRVFRQVVYDVRINQHSVARRG